MVAVLRTESLAKRFGAIRAVDGVDLRVEEGDIYGFLGLNGAGKTTTIRMLLRLVRADAGRVEIFGMDLGERFIEIMRRVGSLVEAPACYPYLTAVENLEILRMLHGGIPRPRIDEILEQVGLGPRRDSAVRTYSQGMKQRLGIAMALLADPDLVLLDEPTNGLDPQGVNDVRSLILTLNRERGATFLICSHLLHEVELTCTRVGIIRNGRMVVEEKVQALLARTAGSVRIECTRRDEALRILRSLDFARDPVEADGALLVRVDPGNHARLNAELVSAGVDVSAFAPVRLTLEEFFLSAKP